MEARNKSTIERFRVVDGVEMCFCSAHHDFSPCSEHTRANHNPHSYDYKCRKCIREGRLSKLYPNSDQRETERIMTLHILKSIGYDTESSISIHEQFLTKHHL